MAGKNRRIAYFCLMQSAYLPLLVFFAGGLVFVGLGFGLSWLLQTRKPNPEKLSFYECGEEAGPLGSRFNLRFFLPAIVFLLMEVEIVLMAPVFLNRFDFSDAAGKQIMKTELLLFILILAAGFLLALGKGFFEWQKPSQKAPAFQGPVPDFMYEQYNLYREKQSAS